MTARRRLLLTAIGLIALQGISTPTPVKADGGAVSLHGFVIGGPILNYPLVRLIFWGSDWANGWIDNDTSNPYGMGSVKAKAYITNFFTYMGSPPVGGATWHHIFENQYCTNMPIGTVHCGYPNNQSAVFISGMEGVLDVVVDNVTVPFPPSSSDIAAEVSKISSRYAYDSRIAYMVFLPHFSGYVCTQGTSYGHHFVSTPPGYVVYAYIAYPDAAGCRDEVNLTDDALGHGYYDFYSITSAHEWAEIVTDPGDISWYDTNRANEVGDKCAGTAGGGTSNFLNFAWYGGFDHFAAQRIWTNEWQGTGGCAYR